LVFGYDSAYVATPPISAEMLAKWIKNNPGQFSYPKPPDFTGTSFLKQILLEVSPDRSVFSKPADQADIDQALMPLWQWLDQVHPYLWRSGKAFPANYTALVQLLGDGEISIAMAFNPTEFSNGISQGILPDTVRTYIHDDGTLANVHFVAIPFNAAAPEAAQVVANFLLSPEAQIHKADTAIWGDPTVLDLSKVSASDQAAFMALPRGVATLSETDLGLTLAEPHPSWVGVIEREWARRYTGQ
jgi:putative thiamine transport system substrate-binding protein